MRKPYSQLVMPAFCRLWLRFGRLSEREERIAIQTKCFVGVLSWYDLQALVVIFSKSGQADFSIGGV